MSKLYITNRHQQCILHTSSHHNNREQHYVTRITNNTPYRHRHAIIPGAVRLTTQWVPTERNAPWTWDAAFRLVEPLQERGKLPLLRNEYQFWGMYRLSTSYITSLLLILEDSFFCYYFTIQTHKSIRPDDDFTSNQL